MMEGVAWEALLPLLEAPSKDAVADLLHSIWASRRASLSSDDSSRLQRLLSLPSSLHLDQLVDVLLVLIKKSVYESLKKAEIQELFPENFHPQLRNLLAQLLEKYQLGWKEDALKNQVSLPRLKSMTWKVQEMNNGNSLSTIGLVNLKVHNPARNRESDVSFQVSKESLSVVLESLRKVNDQLASMSASN